MCKYRIVPVVTVPAATSVITPVVIVPVIIIPGGSAGEEDDALQFAVVEEVVERPDAAFLAVRV